MSEIKKSPQDNNLYQYLTLDNQLEVLIIHNAETDKAAAAMDVHVGYFSDPHSTQGLAHFCEHMLFLGTEKYPDEKTYIDYLTQHGGNWNAYTFYENTNYYFDVSHSEFEGALDRFAQFFIAPLFTQSATDREMNAINSEHVKNLQNDNWRVSQLLSSVSDPTHPYSKFGTGSLETLQKHKDIRQQLLDFHSKYYSANIMKLVVLGKEPLSVLTQWVREKFSSIPNKNTTKPHFPGNPLTKSQLGVKYDVVPVKNLRSLTLYWPIPAEHKLWRSKPSHVLGHLIGHEGEGSILAELKKKGWVNELLAGSLLESTGFTIFGVKMNLGEEGLDHINDIINIVFEYIALLKKEGIQKWVFDELQSLGEIEFRFKEPNQPINYVSWLAGIMHKYPKEEILAGPYLMYDWEPSLVQSALDCLTPDNFLYLVSTQKFKGKTDLKEEWYSTEYNKTSISLVEIKNWFQPPQSSSIHLPNSNPFLPDNFDRRHNSPRTVPSSSPAAPVAHRTDQFTLWYKYDTTFNVPKAYQIIDIISKSAYSSPKATVLTKLFGKVVIDELNTYGYYAQVAGLDYNIYNTFEGFKLSINGYDCKQHVLIEKIAEKLTNLQFNPGRFENIKEALCREYANFALEPPYQRAIYQTSLLLDSNRWSNEEYAEVCPTITLEDLKAFIPTLLENLYFEALIIGNLSKEYAENTLTVLNKYLKAKPLLRHQLPTKQSIMLQPRTSYIYALPTFNPDDQNSAIQVVFQIGEDTPPVNAIVDLFTQCTTAEAFNQLRTVEQLGYIVTAVSFLEIGIVGFRVIIQSDTKSPDVLDERIEAWIATVEDLLIKMPDEEFQNFKEGLIVQKLQKDKSLKEEVKRWQVEIQHPRPHQFNRSQEEADIVKKTTKAEILEFYRNHIAKGGSLRKKLSVQIFGKGHAIPSPPPPAAAPLGGQQEQQQQQQQQQQESVVYVTDLQQFKKTTWYPIKNNLADFLPVK